MATLLCPGHEICKTRRDGKIQAMYPLPPTGKSKEMWHTPRRFLNKCLLYCDDDDAPSFTAGIIRRMNATGKIHTMRDQNLNGGWKGSKETRRVEKTWGLCAGYKWKNGKVTLVLYRNSRGWSKPAYAFIKYLVATLLPLLLFLFKYKTKFVWLQAIY